MATSIISASETIDVDHSDLNAIKTELMELYRGPRENEYGLLRPTPKAFEIMIGLLSNSASLMKKSFPYGAIAPDGEGGVSIEWYRDEHEVRLVVPADPVTEPPYAYWQSQDRYDIVEHISPKGLAELLEKYLGD